MRKIRNSQFAIEHSELSALVRRAIDALPERQRLTVTMFYIDGLSYQDIAEFMGESVNAVESRLHRARAQLKERMMDAMSETFKPHHLSEQFTNEVLKKVRVMGVGMTGQQSAGMMTVTEAMGKDVSLFMQDEQERQFPVRLTTAEAVYITMALEGRQPPRPMTHDLFKRMLEAFDIKLEKVVLSDVQRGEFTARMLFRYGDERHAVDARAGDAVAMAMRMGIEVFATPTTLKKARRLKSPVPSEAPPAAPVERRQFPIFGERQGVMIYGAVTPPAEEERRKQAEESQRFMRQQTRRWARVAWEKQAAVSVQEVAVDPKGNPVVVLTDAKGARLPIWIGMSEAQAIGRALKNGKVDITLPPAPKKGVTPEFPHDLIKSALDAFGVKGLRVAVNALRESIFFGIVALQRNGAVRHVDARPSDGVALAVRCGCPLYVAREVMKEMGVAPDQPFSTPQVFSTSQAAPIDILHLALRAAIEQNVKRPRITLPPEGEQCRAVVKDKGGKTVWEQVGGSFAECRDYLCNAARIDKASPFPQKGAARCAFGGKHYELQVTVKDKPKAGRVELRLKPVPSVNE